MTDTNRRAFRALGSRKLSRWMLTLIDLNRPVIDPTLVREEAGDVEIPWNRGLSPVASDHARQAYRIAKVLRAAGLRLARVTARALETV